MSGGVRHPKGPQSHRDRHGVRPVPLGESALVDRNTGAR